MSPEPGVTALTGNLTQQLFASPQVFSDECMKQCRELARLAGSKVPTPAVTAALEAVRTVAANASDLDLDSKVAPIVHPTLSAFVDAMVAIFNQRGSTGKCHVRNMAAFGKLVLGDLFNCFMLAGCGLSASGLQHQRTELTLRMSMQCMRAITLVLSSPTFQTIKRKRWANEIAQGLLPQWDVARVGHHVGRFYSNLLTEVAVGVPLVDGLAVINSTWPLLSLVTGLSGPAASEFEQQLTRRRSERTGTPFPPNAATVARIKPTVKKVLGKDINLSVPNLKLEAPVDSEVAVAPASVATGSATV